MSLEGLQQGNGLAAAAGNLGGAFPSAQYLVQREQELRMRCLDMATRGPFAGRDEIIKNAQAMYDFAMSAAK